jgi:solute carrier family 25 carnitine/acylcarnitine transporter 20/29
MRLQLKLPQMSGDPAPTMTHLFAAGGTAGFMYWVLFYPLDVIKSAMQTDALVPSERKFRGIAHATSCLWKEGGVSRFYKGVTPCLLRAVPANAIMLITVVRLGPLACVLLELL